MIDNYSQYENSDEYVPSKSVWSYIKSQTQRFRSDTVVQQDEATGEMLTIKELSEKVETLASSLQKLGLTSGIGICSENNLYFTWILLGALHAGVRCSLLSPRYTERELKHYVELTRPEVIICSKMVANNIYENGKSFGAVCSNYSFIKSIFVCDTTISENSVYKSLATLLPSEVEYENKISADRTFEPTREALVLASSGSTGLPKGVVWTHKSIVEALKLSYIFAKNGETALGLMPFFHAYGIICNFMCLCEGSRFIILSKFNGPKCLINLIESHQINNLYLIPSLLASIVNSSEFTKEKLSCVRYVCTSAGKMSNRLQEKVEELFPSDAVLRHGYGMTETTFMVLLGPYKKNDSSGKLVPPMKCQVISEGKICGIKEIGELCFKGPTIMKCYLNNEKATAEALPEDGWLRSGDLGYFDKDGDFFVVDRIKDMIKYQGNQVSPVEIEETILELPDVLEAAVFAVPSEEFGELPAAAIIAKKTSKLMAQEIEEYVARQLSPHNKLRGGVFFFAELPKTGNGKLQRKALLSRIQNSFGESKMTRTQG
ncbi:luciferin 4-monooxygenase [Athalia rosae]|uniref:luciferin 4-monooxygenase n=1 Tax=Athalia rosae TaxID=37344 RepID=UPI002033C74F|nr:luciferin 4-monooxygenase [Athalia rosae]XP_048508798.1 luciferin 4-monooxygenase [Athalia rosae]XP_048508799.1 luciferin 4-monooxygenase [Athalia rosae]